MNKDDDLIISGSSDVTLDISNQGAACETLSIGTIDTIDLSGITTMIGSSSNFGSYTIDTSQVNQVNYSTSYGFNGLTLGDGLFSSNTPRVNITQNGIDMPDGSDIKIGDRSLNEFMKKMEDRLAILHPNEALEEKWEQLKDLRRQYEALEKDILEKEKIMDILKKE